MTFTIEFNLLQQRTMEQNYNLQSGDLLIQDSGTEGTRNKDIAIKSKNFWWKMGTREEDDRQYCKKLNFVYFCTFTKFKNPKKGPLGFGVLDIKIH